MGEERRVMLVSGLFLGFVLGIVFGETMEMWLDFLYRTTLPGVPVELVFSPPESRGDAVATEQQKDE